ncbi:hypothetical protein FOZ61_004015 [Perkinsus olseni]|nr:hypothetical protein FOZ61_004015 [Perkinsus olseni]
MDRISFLPPQNAPQGPSQAAPEVVHPESAPRDVAEDGGKAVMKDLAAEGQKSLSYHSLPGWAREDDNDDDEEVVGPQLSEALLKAPFFDINRFKIPQKLLTVQADVSRCVLCRAMLLNFGVEGGSERPIRQSELCRLHEMHYVRFYLYRLILSRDPGGTGRQRLKQLRAKAADKLEALERPLMAISVGYVEGITANARRYHKETEDRVLRDGLAEINRSYRRVAFDNSSLERSRSASPSRSRRKKISMYVPESRFAEWHGSAELVKQQKLKEALKRSSEVHTMWVRMALEADDLEEKERVGWFERSQLRKERRVRSRERVQAKLAEVRTIKEETSNDLKRTKYERDKMLAEKRVHAEVEKLRVDTHAKKEAEIKRSFAQYTVRLRKRLLPIACKFNMDKGLILHRYMALATCLASSRAVTLPQLNSAADCLQSAGLWCPRIQSTIEAKSVEKARRRRSSLLDPTEASAARSAAPVSEEVGNRSHRDGRASIRAAATSNQQQQPSRLQRESVKSEGQRNINVAQAYAPPPPPAYSIRSLPPPLTRATIGVPLPFTPSSWQPQPTITSSIANELGPKFEEGEGLVMLLPTLLAGG